MNSSRSIALRRDPSLNLGWTKQRAAETIAADRGPVTPVWDINSAIFGVSLNGTGLLDPKSPEI